MLCGLILHAATVKFARDFFDMPTVFGSGGHEGCWRPVWQPDFRGRPVLRVGRRGLFRLDDVVPKVGGSHRFRVRLLQTLLGKACEKLLGSKSKSLILPDLHFQLVEHNLCEWKQQHLRRMVIPRRQPRSTAVHAYGTRRPCPS